VIKISPRRVYRLLHPKLTVIVSAQSGDKKNAMTVAWITPVSANPPLIVIAVAPKRFTHKLIEESKEFIVNIPDINKLELVNYMGTVSGRDVDKLAKVKYREGVKVKAPVLEDCVAWLECKVVNQVEAGDHTLFMGKVVKAYAREGVFDEIYNIEEFKPVFHLGGDNYTTVEKKIYKP